MTKRYNILLKMALVGVALAASGCSLGTAELVEDLPPGLATAFGNDGGQDHDNGNRGGGNLPGGGNQANNGDGGQSTDGDDQQGGDVGTAGGGEEGGTGPGNSDFGRGGHANAGSGNGGEFDDDGNEVDPGNSGNSKGKSGSQD